MNSLVLVQLLSDDVLLYEVRSTPQLNLTSPHRTTHGASGAGRVRLDAWRVHHVRRIVGVDEAARLACLQLPMLVLRVQ